MDILNKTLQMYRGFSNEPMIPDDQQDDLEASNNNVQETIFDDCKFTLVLQSLYSIQDDKSNLPSSNTLQEPIVMPNEDVVIDFATEGNQTTPSPERENAPLRTQGRKKESLIIVNVNSATKQCCTKRCKLPKRSGKCYKNDTEWSVKMEYSERIYLHSLDSYHEMEPFFHVYTFADLPCGHIHLIKSALQQAAIKVIIIF